jgi:hypothetical protein
MAYENYLSLHEIICIVHSFLSALSILQIILGFSVYVHTSTRNYTLVVRQYS